jgi:spore germination protein GerM
MSGTQKGRLRAFALAAVIAVAAGCGVSTNDEPQPIARENVPSDLLETEAAAGEEPVADPTDLQQVPVWFLVDDGETIKLHKVMRGVPWPVQTELRIDALLNPDGPTPDERSQGISTAIPGDARLTAVPTQDGTVLEVSLSDDFYELRGNTFMRAVAQLVFTATEMPGVLAVRFVNQDGRFIEVLDDEGESRDEPVGREDYTNLDPEGD